MTIWGPVSAWGRTLLRGVVYEYISFQKQQFFVTHRYTVLQDKEKTWTILNRPTIMHVMFLRKYTGKQLFVHTSHWYKLSRNVGLPFWRLHSEKHFNFNTILSKLCTLWKCITMTKEVQKTSFESLKWSNSNVRLKQKYSFVYKVSVQIYSKCNIMCNIRSFSVKLKLQ